MPKFVTPVRIWAVVALVAGAIAIALIGVVIHLKTSEPSCAVELEIPDWEKYAWLLFRSEAEQREIELQLKPSLILHGCCNSTISAQRPTSALTIYNVNVTVIQNYNGRYQYFPIDTCQQMANCDTCRCEQEYGYFTALVQYHSNNAINISQIKLLACCHCINKSP